MDNKLAKVIFNDLLSLQRRKGLNKNTIEYLSKSLINENLGKTNCKTELELLKNLGLPPKIKDINTFILQTNLDVLNNKSDTELFVSFHDKSLNRLDLEEPINLTNNCFSYKALNSKYLYGGHHLVPVAVEIINGEVFYTFIPLTALNNFINKITSEVLLFQSFDSDLWYYINQEHPSFVHRVGLHISDGSVEPNRGPQTWPYGMLGNTGLRYTKTYSQFIAGTGIRIKEENLSKILSSPKKQEFGPSVDVINSCRVDKILWPF